MTKQAQDKYNRKRYGIDTSHPFACLVREWPAGLFSVAMLIDASHDLIVDRWLCRNVTETEARAVMTAQVKARTE